MHIESNHAAPNKNRDDEWIANPSQGFVSQSISKELEDSAKEVYDVNNK